MLDKSLARGATRTALRAADKSIRSRIANVCKQARIPPAAKDEASAKQLADAWRRIYGDRLVALRTELAARHSEVLCVAFDTVEEGGRVDFWGSVLLSAQGNMLGGLGDLQISHHAVERFLQREAGLVSDFSSVLAEFAPALVMLISDSAGITGGRAGRDVLLPTRTGALLATLLEEEEAPFYMGTTWLRADQLRREQRQKRDDALSLCSRVIKDATRPLVRAGTYAGRKDKVLFWIQASLAAFLASASMTDLV